MAATIRPLRTPRIEQPTLPPTSAQDSVIRIATQDGFERGERSGYMAGWRWGTVCGTVLGCFVGSGAIVAALHLGMWFGTGR